jgi:transposase
MSLIGDEARRLRDSGVPPAEIQARLGVTKQVLTSWLARRPLAKDESRARAVELRRDGWSVNDIALELGVARSTAWLWVRHLPLDPSTERARAKAEHSKLMTDARWMKHRAARDAEHARVATEAAAFVGELSEREILLLGAAIYWCEGSKSKPWRDQWSLKIINSDPGLLEVFLRFVELFGRRRVDLTYRLSIHETADVSAAESWWKSELGIEEAEFRRATIKRHVAQTKRQNVGDGYRGCLIIEVSKSRKLYWQVEGVMSAIAARCRIGDSAHP